MRYLTTDEVLEINAAVMGGHGTAGLLL